MLSERLRLEDFILGPEIGKGGFGTVYEATHRPSKEKVALKKIPIGACGVPIHRIESEYKLLNGVSHNNIVKYHGNFQEDGFHYIVLELCEFGSMRSYVKKNGPLSEPIAAYVLKQIVCAVSQCHKKKVMHRDLSAGNILISRLSNPKGKGTEPFPTIKICDFGLARCFSDATPAQTIAGTPGYMAREVLHGRSYTEAADIYSMGAALYTMLTGEDPPPNRKPSFVKLSDVAADLIKQMMADDGHRITLNGILYCEFMKTGLENCGEEKVSRYLTSTSVDRQGSTSVERRKVDRGDVDKYSRSRRETSYERRAYEQEERLGRGTTRDRQRDTSSPHYSRDRLPIRERDTRNIRRTEGRDDQDRIRSMSQPPKPLQREPSALGRDRGERAYASGGSERQATVPRRQVYSDSTSTAYARPVSSIANRTQQQPSRIPPPWPLRIDRMAGKQLRRENYGRINVYENGLVFTQEDSQGRAGMILEVFTSESSGQMVSLLPAGAATKAATGRDRLVESSAVPLARYTSLNSMPKEHREIYLRARNLLIQLGSQVEKVILRRPKEFPWAVAKIMENGDFRIASITGDDNCEKLVRRAAQGNSPAVFKCYLPRGVGSGADITDEDTLRRMRVVYEMMSSMERLVDEFGQQFPFTITLSTGGASSNTPPSRVHSAAVQRTSSTAVVNGSRPAAHRTPSVPRTGASTASAPATLFPSSTRLTAASAARKDDLPAPRPVLNELRQGRQYDRDGMTVREFNGGKLGIKHQDGRFLRMSTGVEGLLIYKRDEGEDIAKEYRFFSDDAPKYPREALPLISKLRLVQEDIARRKQQH